MANGRLKTVIEIDHRAFDQGLARIDKSLAQSEKKAKQFGKSLDSSTGNLGNAIANMAAKYLSVAAAINLMTKALMSSAETLKNFERKNAELASVLGTSTAGVKELTDAAKDLGRRTEFTSSEVTELQTALARLGYTKDQILDMQETTLKFAAAVNTDLGRAANFAGAALRGFGLQAEDSAHLLDVMAAATTKSALDFSKLETSMSIVAPIAHSFGLTVEDTVTLLGSLANAGFDASSAATATRNILLNLADANGKLAKGLGHTAKTFPEIIAALKECKEKGIDLNSALEMTDKRSVSAFSALISGAASADELRQALGSVDGTLDQMYETMTNNLQGAIKQLQSAWEGFILTMQGANGPMTSAVKSLADGINNLTDHADEFGRTLVELIATFGVYKAALITMNALKATSALVTKGWTVAEILHYQALLVAEKAQKALNSTILKNPYVLAAAAVATLAYGIYKLATASTDAEKAVARLDKADREMNKGISSETAKLDILFAKLKAAKKGTTEYDDAKKAIMSKYGQYLSKLGDEKKALDDIALAYRTITEEITKAAKAKAMESFISTEADTYGQKIADIRENLYKSLQSKFGEEKLEDGTSKVETYFARLSSVVEGFSTLEEQLALDPTLQDAIDSFDKISWQTVGYETKEVVSNIIKGYLDAASDAKDIMDDVVEQASIRWEDRNIIDHDVSKILGDRTKEELDQIIPELQNAATEFEKNKKPITIELGDFFKFTFDSGDMISRVLAKANQNLQNLNPDTNNNNGNNDGGGGGGGSDDSAKKEAARARKELEKQEKDLWKKVADASVSAMRDGTAKRLAEIDNEKAQALAALDDEYEKLKELAKKSGKAISQETTDSYAQIRSDMEKSYEKKTKDVLNELLESRWDYLSQYGTIKEQELAITQKYDKAIEKESDEYKRKSLERQKADELAQLNESRLAYLEQYGTYKEKEAAITEKYNSQIARSNDEVQKMILGKERDKALRELEQQYNSKYHLIFADAESLSDNLLAQAIDATQEAIKKAKDSGDIQALTELYERLRQQMNVQGDKQRGWGWNGISEGFALRSAANGKRTAADTLEQLLKNSEEAHEVLKEMGVSPEDIEASREEIEQLRADIQRLRDDAANDDANALSFLQKGFTEVGQALSELGSMMSSFRDNMGGWGDTIADIGEGLSAIGSKSETIQKAFSGSMGKGEAWSTIISGTIELIGMVGQSIAENKRIQEEWNRTIEQAEHKYKMLKLEAMDYKQQNIFGVENPYKKAIDGAMQYRAAMEALNEQINKLAAGQVQTGTKKVTNWKNVGKGAATGAAVGAAVGTVVPAIGTAIGTAIGAIGGAIAGLFSKKRVAVFDSLKNVYGELFDPNTYELNPKLLADYEKLDADTKQIVDNWEEIRKKAQEAEQQMRDTFKNLSGDIGNQLSDSLINAFRNGELYSAIDDFHDKMTSTIEDIMEQMVFSSTMGAMFDELEERMVKSFDTGGDEDIVDDLIWMENEYQKRLYQYESAMSDVKESLRSLGYDAWKPDEDEEERSGATKTGITATQDSVDESNARMTTIQGHTYELNENVRDMKASQQLLVSNTASILEHVQGIHKDTTILAEKTDDIQKDVSGLRSDVGKIITNGVTVKR